MTAVAVRFVFSDKAPGSFRSILCCVYSVHSCVRMLVCVCVCVCARARARVCVRACESVCVCVCVHVTACVWGWGGGGGARFTSLSAQDFAQCFIIVVVIKDGHQNSGAV